MDTSSPIAITNSCKSGDQQEELLLSENNNTAAGQVSQVDVDSVAMTTASSIKPQPPPEDGAIIQEPSDDCSSEREINQSEVIDKDGGSADVPPQEGAKVPPVEEAGDLNENKDELDVDNPPSDAEDALLHEDVVEDSACETVDDKVAVEADKKDNVEKRKDEKIDAVAVVDAAAAAAAVATDDDVNAEAAKDAVDSWSKMHLTEDVSEGNHVQPSSPDHAEQRPNTTTSLPNITTTKSIQQNGVNKDSATALVDTATTEREEIEHKKTTTTTTTTTSNVIVTNGNDHAEDDEDTKTEQGNSPEYVQSTEDASTAAPPKRRMSSSSATEPLTAGQTNSKRMKITTLENQDFQTRDQVLNNYMENMDCTGFEGLKKHSEQLLSEIQKLGEFAKVKEREWNQILHQKKLREELLLRLQRAKQILVLQTNGSTNPKHQDQLLHKYNLQQQQQQQKYQQQSQQDMMADKGRQGPLVDVQKMISDYRQTHPESIPRRGRRIRGETQQGGQRYETGNLLTFSNMALGSGSQVRTSSSGNSGSTSNINQDIYNEFSLLLSSMDNDRLKTASSSSIKELLAQFARMSASERQDLLSSVKGPHNIASGQTTYAEVTVHAVQQANAAPTAPSTSNSLLHGILTKPTKASTTTTAAASKEPKQSFSPTLARLLTAPEQRSSTRGENPNQNNKPTANSTGASASSLSTHSLNHQHHHHKNTTAQNNSHLHQSLSDLILSSTKARNEITITPVQQYEDHSKSSVHQQDDEADDSADRLVIDEGDAGRNKQMDEEAGEEVPQCQGCNHKAAQFVCAGCGNQWYCSRDCQVSAWDEHSEVCSG